MIGNNDRVEDLQDNHSTKRLKNICCVNYILTTAVQTSRQI